MNQYTIVSHCFLNPFVHIRRFMSTVFELVHERRRDVKESDD